MIHLATAEPLSTTLTFLEADVVRLLPMEVAIDAVADAFTALGLGRVQNQPRFRLGPPDAVLNVMAAVVPDWAAMGVKSYPAVHVDPSKWSTSTLLIYELGSGRLRAMIEADTLGQLRTGAASAVATRWLARPESKILSVFGVGYQAEGQLVAVSAALPKLEAILVVARTPERARAFAARMAHLLSVPIQAATAQAAVSAADVIVTATRAVAPVFDGAWVRPGTHINAVGSNHLDHRELDRATVAKADRVVVDALDVARIDSGDLHDSPVRWERVVELGAVITGRAMARTSAHEITLFESHGLAVEDLACGIEVVARANGGERKPR